MEVVIATVGTSALGEGVGICGEDQDGLQTRIRRFENDARGVAAAELARMPGAEKLLRELVREHGLMLDALDGEPALFEKVSAEMTSTKLLLRHCAGGELRIALLASDTATGLLCARVNGELMHARLLDPVCTCGGFAAGAMESPCGKVRVRVVEGMEAGRLEEIQERLTGICWEEARGCDPVYVNITGGYKGAIPSLTWIAIHVLAGRAEIFYQHQGVRAVTRLEVVKKERVPGGETKFELVERVLA